MSTAVSTPWALEPRSGRYSREQAENECGERRAVTPDIEVRSLGKRFGTETILDGVDLRAERGSVLCLLGPNGAGKTTVVRVLATLLPPDVGSARIAGLDVVAEAARVRELIGVTGQYAAVDDLLTGTGNLALFGRLTGLSWPAARARAAEMLERLGLTRAASKPVKTYSGGMRRRLDLAASLLHRPRVLFLDEPTTGLDPHSRGELWSLVEELVADGTTVLLTTQYLEEADRLADTVAVLAEGRLIATGRPMELKRRVGGHRVEFRPPQRMTVREAADATTRLLGTPAESGQGTVRLPLDDPQSFPEVAQRLLESGLARDQISLGHPSLDEVFLALTGGAEQPPKEADRANG